MSSRSELAADLLMTVGRLRRQIRRTAGPAIGTGLPESAAELLRLVGRRPGISVRDAATELSLAANTASTLVSRLTGEGLLERSVDPNDRRVGRLRLAASAQTVADASRALRRATLTAALDRLDDDEIVSLTTGLDTMSKITDMLAAAR